MRGNKRDEIGESIPAGIQCAQRHACEEAVASDIERGALQSWSVVRGS